MRLFVALLAGFLSCALATPILSSQSEVNNGEVEESTKDNVSKKPANAPSWSVLDPPPDMLRPKINKTSWVGGRLEKADTPEYNMTRKLIVMVRPGSGGNGANETEVVAIEQTSVAQKVNKTEGNQPGKGAVHWALRVTSLANSHHSTHPHLMANFTATDAKKESEKTKDGVDADDDDDEEEETKDQIYPKYTEETTAGTRGAPQSQNLVHKRAANESDTDGHHQHKHDEVNGEEFMNFVESVEKAETKQAFF